MLGKFTVIKIYSDSQQNNDRAWEELKRKLDENIQEKNIINDVIKKFTQYDIWKLNKLARDFDFQVKVIKRKGHLMFRGHRLDMRNVEEKIGDILKDVKDKGSIFGKLWSVG